MGESVLVTSMPKFKLVFLGDIYVGKTSIINQFMYENFDNNYQATIGIDFLSKTLNINEKSMRLQLWDTAGQERFRSLIPNYIRDSSAAIIVYDVTNQQTFDSIEKWVEDVRNERGDSVVIAIVANKIDKTDERCVTKEAGEAKAASLRALYKETSAKTGQYVKDLFVSIATSFGAPAPATEAPRGVPLAQPALTAAPTQGKNKCC